MVETINKLIRVSRQLLQEYGREPTPEEIAKEMGVSEEKVREITKIAQEPVSLETPIGEEEDSHLGDFIPDDDIPAPAEAAAFTMLKEQLTDVLDTLTPPRGEGAPPALRPGRRPGADAGGGRPRVQRHPRAHPPDRGKGPAQAPPPSRSKKLKDFLE